MPAGDGTGPWGTFRNCVPVNAFNEEARYSRRFAGRGAGYGRGFFGRGFRARQFAYAPLPAQEPQQAVQQTEKAESKNNEINALEQELLEIKQRLEELKKER
jgi:hypothetical protein